MVWLVRMRLLTSLVLTRRDQLRVDVIDIGAVILFAPPITAVKRYPVSLATSGWYCARWCSPSDRVRSAGTAVGSRFIVIGVGAIEIAGIDLPGGVECGILRRRRRIARQADGRDPAIRGVVLPDADSSDTDELGYQGRRPATVRCHSVRFQCGPDQRHGFFPIRFRRNAALSLNAGSGRECPGATALPMLAEPSIPESGAAAC